KEQFWEDQPGGGAVDEEVVPLDGGADRRGDDRLAQLRTVFPVRKPAGCGHAGHGSDPPESDLFRLQAVNISAFTNSAASARRDAGTTRGGAGCPHVTPPRL